MLFSSGRKVFCLNSLSPFDEFGTSCRFPQGGRILFVYHRFECMPVQACVPSEQSPASRNVLCGQAVGPHSAKETERLKAPPVSSNWPQRVQLPLKQQINTKQVPVQSQWTHPVETSKQVPV